MTAATFAGEVAANTTTVRQGSIISELPRIPQPTQHFGPATIDERSIAIPLAPAALTLRQASAYIGLGDESDWLMTAPVPRVDLRKVGAGRPVWRWRVVDLDAFLKQRLVQPGESNPQESQ